MPTNGFARIPLSICTNYEVYEWRHATAIMQTDFPIEWDGLIQVLSQFVLKKSDMLKEGTGNKSAMARGLNGAFNGLGWKEKAFAVSIVVDGTPHNSPTHGVDYFKNSIAVETEWNNKDPFFDRDLNNFRLLHQIGVISVGVIITRADELQDIFNALGKKTSAGPSSTHISKLLPKIEGGGAGGCPLLVFGIKKVLYDPTI